MSYVPSRVVYWQLNRPKREMNVAACKARGEQLFNSFESETLNTGYRTIGIVAYPAGF